MAVESMTSKELDRLCRFMRKSRVFGRNFDIYRLRNLDEQMTFREYLIKHCSHSNVVMDYLYGDEAFSIYAVFNPENGFILRIGICGGHLEIDRTAAYGNRLMVREVEKYLAERNIAPEAAILQDRLSFPRANLKRKEFLDMWNRGELTLEKLRNAQGD